MRAFKIFEFRYLTEWDWGANQVWHTVNNHGEFIRAVESAYCVGVLKVEDEVYICIGVLATHTSMDWPCGDKSIVDGSQRVMWDGRDHYLLINMYRMRSSDLIDPLLLTIEDPQILVEEIIKDIKLKERV